MGLLRLYLALCVVLVHSGYNYTGVDGHFAVMSFFVISGFYMALVLNEKYGPGRTLTFYAARFLRLWPTYIVTFAFVLLFIHGMPGLGDQAWGATIYLRTVAFSLIGYETLAWFGLDRLSGLVVALDDVRGTKDIRPLDSFAMMRQMWTVGLEICFYAIAPLVARRRRALLLAAALAYLAHVLISAHFAPLHPLRGRFALNFIYLFFFGMIAYHAYVRVRPILDHMHGWKRHLLLAGALVFAIGTIFAEVKIGRHFGGGHWGLKLDPVYAAFALAIIPLFALSRHSRTDRFIGELSYPVYVVHMPIVTNWLLLSHRSDPAWIPVTFAVTLALAAALHVLVAVPVEYLRRRMISRGGAEGRVTATV